MSDEPVHPEKNSPEIAVTDAKAPFNNPDASTLAVSIWERIMLLRLFMLHEQFRSIYSVGNNLSYKRCQFG
jgi:hypothetical protein